MASIILEGFAVPPSTVDNDGGGCLVTQVLQGAAAPKDRVCVLFHRAASFIQALKNFWHQALNLNNRTPPASISSSPSIVARKNQAVSFPASLRTRYGFQFPRLMIIEHDLGFCLALQGRCARTCLCEKMREGEARNQHRPRSRG